MSNGVFGWGFEAGLAYTEDVNSQDFSRQQAQLKEEIKKAHIQTLGDIAMANAGIALVNALTAELEQEAAGVTGQRRLSDPDKVVERNAAFNAAAERNLRRLSEQHHNVPLTFGAGLSLAAASRINETYTVLRRQKPAAMPAGGAVSKPRSR